MTHTYTSSAITAPVDAVFGAAGHLARNWGDHGYSIGVDSYVHPGLYVFVARHTDGSEWFIATDRYGNVGDGDTPTDAIKDLRATLKSTED
jgi:hypothetical protein